MGIKQVQVYHGVEQGPIRPPSEANSLLIRLTRNCPWNKCSFCAVYKGEKFSLRTVEHIFRDIDTVHHAVRCINREAGDVGSLTAAQFRDLAGSEFRANHKVLYTAANWLQWGEGSVFLQDANSLVMKSDDLLRILAHLMQCFPWITRITSYARSHTINRINDVDMRRLAQAGLNRIHVGMESGSDEVLKRINKGVTKQQHITAGQRVKQAGIELSEYVMPGLGGMEFSAEHALETADALNIINADFIRLRTLAVIPGTPLHDTYMSGGFSSCSDVQITGEIRDFIAALEGITSSLKSDHMRNLIQEVEGKLPHDKPRMLQLLDRFLTLATEEQTLYQLGRRTGYFTTMDDLQSPSRRSQVTAISEQLQVTADNVDQIIRQYTRQAM
jgi:hypothetical protein